MFGFVKSISFLIWLPFSLTIAVTIMAVGYYYPKKQEEIYHQQLKSKLSEMAKTVALGVEISLENDNFKGLEQTINLARGTADFEFIAIIERDSSQSENVFASNPKDYEHTDILKIDTSKFIYVEQPVQSNFEGIVRMATSKESIEKALFSINEPIYKFLGALFLGSMLIFYFIAVFVASPIKSMTFIANELFKGNYDVVIRNKQRNKELLDLSNALIALKENLKLVQIQNNEFNKILEEQIIQRTSELEKTTLKLESAQKISQTGHFEFVVSTEKWEISKSVAEILNLDTRRPDVFVSFLFDKENHSLLELVKGCIFNKTALKNDLKLKIQNNGLDTDIWLSVHLNPMLDEKGNTSLINGTIQDITIRKHIENELHKLSLVAKNTSNLVVITDQNWRITWVNESLSKLTGYDGTELIGKTPKIFQCEKTNPETISYINQKLSSLEKVRTEVLNKGKYDNEYWIDLSIVPLIDNNNEHIGFIAVETDITERKQFENEIKEREEEYKKILENSSEMIHTLDNNGNLVWANRSWIEKMKLDSLTIKGQSLIKYLDNKTLEEFQRVMPELYKGNTIKDLDCTFISAEGENLHLIGRAIPLLKNGEMTGSQAYLHDITQIKKAEEELRNLLHLTQRQNDRLKNFAHIVSHNIRSHSANLSGLVRELSEIDNEEERLMFTKLIKAGTEKLNETIFNLNEIVTINENSNISLIPKSLYIEIEKTLSVVANNIIQNNITIENNVQADIEVMVVSSYLESIVLNLITNAIKYRDSNKKAFIRINAEKNGPLVRLCVEDNGLGIDLNKYGSKLFGMYKTFHKHPDARGVGLFITKAQIEAMGGKIEVESETGIGTKFFVQLVSAI